MVSTTASISSVRGLPCRVPEGCEFRVLPLGPSVDHIVLAGKDRDAHEQSIHGYHHRPFSQIVRGTFNNQYFPEKEDRRGEID